MSKYAVLFRFTPEAAAAMMRRPNDRVAAVRETFQAIGGDVDAYYWMLGPYDGLLIADAPDAAAIAAVMVTVAGSGALAQTESHELLEADRVTAILQRAADISYRAPGA
jgi:uncharacterized protein with GYD domain